MDDVAYKILSIADFADLEAGCYEGAPIDVEDGYIHLSTAAQLTQTVDKHFAGRTGLIIAAVDLQTLGKSLRWEVSRNDALFPHLYGRLEAASITAACPLERCADGTVKLPKPWLPPEPWL